MGLPPPLPNTQLRPSIHKRTPDRQASQRSRNASREDTHVQPNRVHGNRSEKENHRGKKLGRTPAKICRRLHQTDQGRGKNERDCSDRQSELEPKLQLVQRLHIELVSRAAFSNRYFQESLTAKQYFHSAFVDLTVGPCVLGLQLSRARSNFNAFSKLHRYFSDYFFTDIRDYISKYIRMQHLTDEFLPGEFWR